MLAGVLFILAACLGWSLVFVIPEFLTGFSPLEISVGRFFFFGLISIVVLSTRQKRQLIHRSHRAVWKKAFFLSFLSTIVCYTATVFCINYAGAALAALLFGMVPICVALCGNFRKREYPFRCFIIPCLMMAIGIVLTNIEAFYFEGSSSFSYFWGVICGIIGVGCWILYVLITFDFMEKNKQITSTDWVVMIGACTFFLTILAAVGLFAGTDLLSRFSEFTQQLQYFLVGSLVLGVICSWLSLYFWTQGNLRLPISLAGQLAIFELIFGLFLIYCVHARLPALLEITGIACMVAGVLYGFKALERSKSEIAQSDLK